MKHKIWSKIKGTEFWEDDHELHIPLRFLRKKINEGIKEGATHVQMIASHDGAYFDLYKQRDKTPEEIQAFIDFQEGVARREAEREIELLKSLNDKYKIFNT